MKNHLFLQKGNLVLQPVDCIVNAANSQLRQGGGVCGAIFAAAGATQLQQACDWYGCCPTGKAVITPGFRLKAKHIIHAVGPRWVDGQHGEPHQLASCYQAALELALQYHCHSIAFPLISSGVYGYPKKEAWQVAIQCIWSFLRQHPDVGLDVTITVLTDEDLCLGASVLQQVYLWDGEWIGIGSGRD